MALVRPHDIACGAMGKQQTAGIPFEHKKKNPA